MPGKDEDIVLAEQQDNEDELEEDVGVPPRKVTMEEFIEADTAFDDLIESEEELTERTPFRPGDSAKYILTDTQRTYLNACIDEFDKYLYRETERYSFGNEEANKKLKDLNNAMKKIIESGLDSLTPEERATVDGYNSVMNDIPYHEYENRTV